MATAEDLKKVVCSAIDSYSSQLHELSRDLWSHPELKWEERYAHDTLTSFLEKAGFTSVDRSYVVETGFRAELGETGQPHVAVLCEYDALPEIGHACGHNLIAEAGVAAGIGIKAAMEVAKQRGTSIGKLTVLGTPAEEGGGGKVDMVRAGSFQNVDVAMMVHPGPRETLVTASMNARKILNAKFFGKASHAAGFPWEGLNALDAAVLAYTSISVLRQQCKPTWRIHGVILNGGVKPNIIPEETELDYYIRAPTIGEVDTLAAKVVSCFEGAAKATGCRVELTFGDRPYYNVVSNPSLASLYETNARKLGVKFDVKQQVPSAGSTDMGNVSHVVPSIHPFYIIGNVGVVNHTREFTDLAGADSAQEPTLTRAKVMAMSAIDVFTQPELLNTIKREFTEQLKQQ